MNNFELKLIQTAREVCPQFGLPPSTLIAQGMFESGHGNTQAGNFNYFGRKYTEETKNAGLYSPNKKWTREQGGEDAYVQDEEHIYLGDDEWKIMAEFKNYASMVEACTDWCLRIVHQGPEYTQSNWDPYKEAREALPDKEAFNRLLASHYGSDKRYYELLTGIIEQYNLTQYD